MIFEETKLKGSYVLMPQLKGDSRGWFTRIYCENEMKKIGHNKSWIQINHSFTNKAGTIRGMHYQKQPFGEIKMLRCISGAVYDVIVDLRKNSLTCLQWYGVVISQENKKMIYIPEGFAHGFQSLTPDAELIYHHSQFYTPAAESGLRYDDPALKIEWPRPVSEISDRDNSYLPVDINFKAYE